ncbi:DUF1475 family protein [Novipirellula sp.]|uniref:DUF1475 family protein n=1 Tax=Novipirellula sp. TaxID=2795430 RepID=UPI003564440F
MKWILVTLCLIVIACMTWVTVMASLDRSVLQAGRGLWPDPWFLATLMDAYFGFLTFYVWVAYKEQRWIARVVWFVAIMLLGNFAMSGYLLWQLSKIKDFTWKALLLRPEPAGAEVAGADLAV